VQPDCESTVFPGQEFLQEIFPQHLTKRTQVTSHQRQYYIKVINKNQSLLNFNIVGFFP
jgi:hypothetical protein